MYSSIDKTLQDDCEYTAKHRTKDFKKWSMALGTVLVFLTIHFSNAILKWFVIILNLQKLLGVRIETIYIFLVWSALLSINKNIPYQMIDTNSLNYNFILLLKIFSKDVGPLLP